MSSKILAVDSAETTMATEYVKNLNVLGVLAQVFAHDSEYDCAMGELRTLYALMELTIEWFSICCSRVDADVSLVLTFRSLPRTGLSVLGSIRPLCSRHQSCARAGLAMEQDSNQAASFIQ
jgi:hypothetical protein